MDWRDRGRLWDDSAKNSTLFGPILGIGVLHNTKCLEQMTIRSSCINFYKLKYLKGAFRISNSHKVFSMFQNNFKNNSEFLASIMIIDNLENLETWKRSTIPSWCRNENRTLKNLKTSIFPILTLGALARYGWNVPGFRFQVDDMRLVGHLLVHGYIRGHRVQQCLVNSIAFWSALKKNLKSAGEITFDTKR